MSKYISKEYIIRALSERILANKICLRGAKESELHDSEQYFNNLLFEDEQITSIIEELPSVDERPNTHAHWKVVSDGYSDNAYICECSECKDTVWVYKDADRKWNYCPNCGADMRGDTTE